MKAHSVFGKWPGFLVPVTASPAEYVADRDKCLDVLYQSCLMSFSFGAISLFVLVNI